jgi:hypothetical protein
MRTQQDRRFPKKLDTLQLNPTILTALTGSKPSKRSTPSEEIETVVPLSMAE